MHPELRYELAGELGRLYRSRNDIFAIAKAQAGIDEADIPADGTPRILWLAILIQLENLKNLKGITGIIAEGKRLSKLVDWARFEVEVPLVDPAKEEAPASAIPQWVHPDLDVSWEDEGDGPRETTRISNGQVLLMITATLQWSGVCPVDPKLSLPNNDGSLRIDGAEMQWKPETKVPNLLVWRGTFPVESNSWRSRTVKVVWKCGGKQCTVTRRLVSRSGAGLAAFIWLGCVGIFPVIWLYPIYPTIPKVVVGAGGVTGLSGFLGRASDASGLRTWVRGAFAHWERALAIGIVVMSLVIALPVLLLTYRHNLSKQDLEIDGENHATKSTFVTSVFSSLPDGTLDCKCGSAKCSCPSGHSTRGIPEHGVRCNEERGCNNEIRIDGRVTSRFSKNDVPIEAPEVAMIEMTTDALPAGDQSRRITVMGDAVKPRIDVAINIASSSIYLIPVIDRNNFTVTFPGEGTLECGSGTTKIVTLEIHVTDPKPKALHGTLYGATFSWNGTTSHIRACSGSREESTSTSIDDLNVACTGKFAFLTRFESSLIPSVSFAIGKGSEKVRTTAWVVNQNVWACSDGGSTLFLDMTEKVQPGYHLHVTQTITSIGVGDSAIPCPSGNVWIVERRNNPPPAIGSARILPLERGYGMVCADADLETTVISGRDGGRSCTVSKKLAECHAPAFVWTGGCVMTLSNNVVRSIDAMCHRAPADDELIVYIKSLGRSNRYDCTGAEKCLD